MADTKIEWADKVWNPVVGCTKCSPGCLNCYAERFAARLWHMGRGDYGSVLGIEDYKWNGEIFCRKDFLDRPLHWRKPRRIFVCSMSDLFHPKVPFWFFDKVFTTMTKCPQHTFQVLTKRPKRMKEFLGNYDTHSELLTWPKPNIHLGVSISNQAEADEKIPILLQIPAEVRWLSIEPMLEKIDLSRYVFEECRKIQCNNCGSYKSTGVWGIYMCGECGCGEGEEVDPNCEIDGVVVGGESGPGARPMHPDWVRNIRDQCVAAGVPFYFKQWGKWGIAEPVPNDIQKRFRIKDTNNIISHNTIFKIFPEHEISTIPLTGWVKVGKKKGGCILDGRVWKQLP